MNPLNWSGVNILIVEDEEDLRSVLCAFTKKKGATVFSATNGVEAYKIVQDQAIDIVISDIQMPLCNGVELLEKIRKFHPTVPVVFLATGFADISAEQALSSGASALIQKPFKMTALVPLVESVLQKRSQK